MATVRQLTAALRARQVVIARKLDSDIRRSEKSDRVRDLSLLALIAALIKALVDAGAIGEAAVLAQLDTARDDQYDAEPAEPPPPSD